MGNVELRHIRLAERCVERPYNWGSVDRAAQVIADAMSGTVDAALFNEAVEALEKCEFALSEIARFIKPMANDPSLIAARAVLSKIKAAQASEDK